MQEQFESITNSIRTSLESIKTALADKGVEVESLKVCEVADRIREIQLVEEKYILTINASEFEGETLTVSKDNIFKECTVTDGVATVKLGFTGTYRVQGKAGDYVDVEINESSLSTSADLVKKRAVFSESECTEEKIVIHIDSITGNNSNSNQIRVKKNGSVISANVQYSGSDLTITNFEAEDGATYTIEYVLADEVRGSIEILCRLTVIYGIKITEKVSNPSNRVTYTDDAVHMTPVTIDLSSGIPNYGTWKDTWIFKKIYPAMINTDGTIAYKLDPEDQTQKAEGGASDVNNINFDGNAMVVVEKFYTKFSVDEDENELLQISDTKQEGFEAIGFIREDDSEADYICLPMFLGSFDNNSKLRSISGQTIKGGINVKKFREAAQKNGSTYDIETYAMNQIKNVLFLLLFKTCNCRTLGRGRDNKQNQTGILTDKGAIAFDPSSQTVKFLWIEDLFGYKEINSTFLHWEVGLLCQNHEVYVRMKPPYSVTDTTTYEKIPNYPIRQNYINVQKCDNKYGRVPVSCSGGSTSYECSQLYVYTGSKDTLMISIGGGHYALFGRGLDYSYSATSYNSYWISALSLIPPA